MPNPDLFRKRRAYLEKQRADADRVLSDLLPRKATLSAEIEALRKSIDDRRLGSHSHGDKLNALEVECRAVSSEIHTLHFECKRRDVEMERIDRLLSAPDRIRDSAVALRAARSALAVASDKRERVEAMVAELLAEVAEMEADISQEAERHGESVLDARLAGEPAPFSARLTELREDLETRRAALRQAEARLAVLRPEAAAAVDGGKLARAFEAQLAAIRRAVADREDLAFMQGMDAFGPVLLRYAAAQALIGNRSFNRDEILLPLDGGAVEVAIAALSAEIENLIQEETTHV